MGRFGTRPTRDGRGRETPRRNDGEEGTRGDCACKFSLFRFFFGEGIELGPRVKQNGVEQANRARAFFVTVMVINRWASSLEKETYALGGHAKTKHDPVKREREGQMGQRD
jgi:hypothetical protein